MSYDPHYQRQGMSDGAKFGLGCLAVGFCGFMLLCGGALLVAYRAAGQIEQAVEQVAEEVNKAMKDWQEKIDTYAADFEAQGYERVTGQVVNLTSVQQPTVLTVQRFQLNGDSEASLAVLAQSAEINGTINGDLHFLGQMLKIHPGSVITGNLHIKAAQMIDNRGTVEGQVLEDQDAGDMPMMFPFDEFEAESDAGESPIKPSPGDVIDRKEEPSDETSDASAEPQAEETTGDEPQNPEDADLELQ